MWNQKDKPSDQTINDEEKLYSENEAALKNVNVRCCLQCYLLCYRNVCPECGFEYCALCNATYHFNTRCDGSSIIKQQDYAQQLKSIKYINDNGFRECPGCGIVVAKFEGCNHITHINCSKPSEENNCHFCYDCGELLFQSNHQYEKDGTHHFPNGVFSHCRKWNEGKFKINIKNSSQKCAIL